MLTYLKESATAALDQDQDQDQKATMQGRDTEDQIRTGILHVCCGVSYLVLYFGHWVCILLDSSIRTSIHLWLQRGPVFPHPQLDDPALPGKSRGAQTCFNLLMEAKVFQQQPESLVFGSLKPLQPLRFLLKGPNLWIKAKICPPLAEHCEAAAPSTRAPTSAELNWLLSFRLIQSLFT